MKKLLASFVIFGLFAYQPGFAKEVKVEVKGMHCGGCEGLVEEALESVPGVTQVKADSKAGIAILTMKDDAKVDEDAIKKAVPTAGKRYSAGKISQ